MARMDLADCSAFDNRLRSSERRMRASTAIMIWVGLSLSGWAVVGAVVLTFI